MSESRALAPIDIADSRLTINGAEGKRIFRFKSIALLAGKSLHVCHRPRTLSKFYDAVNVQALAFRGVDVKRSSTLALYGNVAVQRAYCPDCHTYAFVRHDRLACCGRPMTQEPERAERMSDPDWQKRIPSPKERQEILRQQDGCCLYCEQPIGSTQCHKGIPFKLRLEWDHMMPYAYSQDNGTHNFAAACHVCNRIKSSRIFRGLDEARVFLANERKHKGYNF